MQTGSHFVLCFFFLAFYFCLTKAACAQQIETDDELEEDTLTERRQWAEIEEALKVSSPKAFRSHLEMCFFFFCSVVSSSSLLVPPVSFR